MDRHEPPFIRRFVVYFRTALYRHTGLAGVRVDGPLRLCLHGAVPCDMDAPGPAEGQLRAADSSRSDGAPQLAVYTNWLRERLSEIARTDVRDVAMVCIAGVADEVEHAPVVKHELRLYRPFRQTLCANALARIFPGCKARKRAGTRKYDTSSRHHRDIPILPSGTFLAIVPERCDGHVDFAVVKRCRTLARSIPLISSFSATCFFT